jgi:signal transduction histidine kinase/ActR/RegA family two-component response regulator
VDISLAATPEDCIERAISELILVALQEGLVLSDNFDRVNLDLGGRDRDLKSDLIAAETAKNSERYLDAIELYDRAIAKTIARQSIELQALTNELAAAFYVKWGKHKFATVYLQDAYNCYQQWGSQAKSTDLAASYPQLFLPSSQPISKLAGSAYVNDEFISTLSYEFRSPLNAISSTSEVLLDEVYGELNEKQLNAISTIDRSSGYLMALINNTIDICKIQSGNIELEIEIVSIVELCHSSLSFVKPAAIQKQIQLDIDVRAIVGNIAVDRLRMRQALIDLLNRAIDTTPAGGRVTLTVSQDLDLVDSQPWIKFSIIDTSKQIPSTPEDPVTKATEKRPIGRYNSIGLGLTIVKPIVELHGGLLRFQSEIGRGNCASISLPYTYSISDVVTTEVDSMADLAALTETMVREIPDSPLILIAEDNELNVDTISSYLNAKGYRTIWAYDGSEAIALTKSERPDLILMDIHMPGIDGIEAMQIIRQDPNSIDLPIIALTALAMSGDKDRCLAAGANEYLCKPIKLKQTISTIQKLLSPNEKVRII